MKNELLPIQPGIRVEVRDGTPRPPDRFKKKLRDWEGKNFDAVVVGEEPAGKYRPEPEYRLQFGDFKLRGFILFFTDRPANQVRALEEEPTYEVKVDGMDAVIAGLAKGGA